ncbi:MAG: hypothetical protein ACTHN3_01760 [Solirubrobacterales bacterium]
MRNKKLVASVVPSLWAAAALLSTTALIAEIAAEPTAQEGVSSSTWTPVTAVTALFFGQDAFHGDFEILSILFGLAVVVLVSLIAGALATAFIVYCLGWAPHPLAAALLGAACGLAAQILLINLLCNWLQPENALYNSLPNWAWWVGMGAWGTALGLTLSRRGRRISAQQGDDRLLEPRPLSEGDRVRVAGPSPLLSADPHPVAPRGGTPR